MATNKKLTELDWLNTISARPGHKPVDNTIPDKKAEQIAREQHKLLKNQRGNKQ